MIPEVAKTSIQGLLGVGIWYWYLNVSKRVKETYVTPELNNTSGSLDADLEAYIPKAEQTVTPGINCTYCGYEKATEEEFCRACHRNNAGILLRDAKNNLS
jgi:hypothetical protein